MIRRFGFLVFALALAVGSCGRQITSDIAPNGTNANGILAGTMQVTFKTVGPLDFTNVGYWIVFNTTGNGVSPYPQYLQANPLNFSYALVLGNVNENVLQGGAFTTQQPQLLQYYANAGTTQSFSARRIGGILSTQLRAVIAANGQANQFTLTFDRAILNQIPPAGCGSGAVASSTPAASPSGSPSASPSPAPTAVATICGQTAPNWGINFFTTDLNGNPLDSLGPNGRTDNTKVITLDTTQAFDKVTEFTRDLGGATLPGNQSAQIAGGEVINAP